MDNLLDSYNLSSDEKDYLLKILNDYSEDGHSSSLDKLYEEDFEEIPVDIETFLTDDNYLGQAWKDAEGNFKLYPFWLEQLKKLFPDNISTNYSTLLESGARGIGKSEVACGCVGTYLLHRILCLKNPLLYYHLKPTEKICFAFMNIKLDLAEEIAISKFQKTIQSSPWFMNRGKMTRRKNKPYWVPPEPVQIIIGSQSDDIVGAPIYFAFFDEISFIRNQNIDRQKEKAQDMISTAIGGMYTRFIHKGKNPTVLAVASSKRSEQSFMEDFIRSLSINEGHSTLIIDKPVWEVKPPETYSSEKFYVGLGNKFLENLVIPDEDIDNLDDYRSKGYKVIEVPIDFKSKFNEDLDRGLCDFAGISTVSSNKYMSAKIVSEVISDSISNPFPDIIEVGNSQADSAQYSDFFDMTKIPAKLKYKPLFIHLDMSISGDMTGIAGVWISGKKVSTDSNNQSKDLSFQLAFSTSVKAPKGYQVSFEKNRQFIRWLKQQGFYIKGVSYDTFQSYDLGQQLSAEGFNCSIISVDRVDSDHVNKPYQFLKSAIYEKRFIMYKSNRLFDEFIDVERNIDTGKVDHTRNFHKDALDAVCGSLYNASHYAEEYAYEFGEDYESLDTVNYSTDVSQEELNNLSRNLATNSLGLNPNVDIAKDIDSILSDDSDILIW